MSHVLASASNGVSVVRPVECKRSAVDPPEPSEPSVSGGLPRPLSPRAGRWLARLAPSCVIVAAVLAWQAYRGLESGATSWQPAVELFAAAASLTMGVVGTRERHRNELR